MGPRSPNKLDAPLRIGVDEVAVNNGQYLMHRAAGYVDCTSHTRNMLKTLRFSVRFVCFFSLHYRNSALGESDRLSSCFEKGTTVVDLSGQPPSASPIYREAISEIISCLDRPHLPT